MVGFGPSGKLSVWKHANTPLAQASSTPDAGSWQHVAYTFDGSTHRLFVNGLEKASTTWEADTAAPTHLHLGCWQGRAHFFNGRLDDVMIYNRALTLAEIAAIVQARPDPKPDNARLARGIDNAPISRTELENLRAEAEAAKQAWLKARADAERAEQEANPPATPELPEKSAS